jgi:hypothetical protein
MPTAGAWTFSSAACNNSFVELISNNVSEHSAHPMKQDTRDTATLGI